MYNKYWYIAKKLWFCILYQYKFVNIIIYNNKELIINIQLLYILIYQQKNMWDHTWT